jgi:hypothetical protein
MRKSRFTEEQIIGIFEGASGWTFGCEGVPQARRHDATFYK